MEVEVELNDGRKNLPLIVSRIRDVSSPQEASPGKLRKGTNTTYVSILT